MAGQYVHSEELAVPHSEDTLPKEVSVESPCGALPDKPTKAVSTNTTTTEDI